MVQHRRREDVFEDGAGVGVSLRARRDNHADDDNDLLSRIPRRASSCFRATKVLSGNLLDEVGRSSPVVSKFRPDFHIFNTYTRDLEGKNRTRCSV